MNEDYPKKRVILYYPTISIRSPQWIKFSLFYWDKIGTIVPWDEWDHVQNDENLKQLGVGGLEKYHPDEVSFLTHNNALTDEFSEEYISLLKSRKFQSMLSGNNEIRGNFEVNIKKFPKKLTSYLTTNNYAHPSRNKLIMSKTNGLLYMALLAKYIADDDKDSITTPGTDYGLYQKLILFSKKDAHSLPGLSFSLNNILPVPSPRATIKQIIDFKDKYEKQLEIFREMVDSYQERLKTAQTVSDLERELGACSKEIADGVGAIDEASKIAAFPIVLKTVETVIASEVVEQVKAELTGVSLPIEVRLGMTVAKGFISAAACYLGEKNKNRTNLMKNSFSYLYQAKKKGILS